MLAERGFKDPSYVRNGESQGSSLDGEMVPRGVLLHL